VSGHAGRRHRPRPRRELRRGTSVRSVAGRSGGGEESPRRCRSGREMIVRSLIRNTVLAAAALSTVACVSTSDAEKLQSQISDLQEQLAQVKRTSSSKEEVSNV